VVRLGRLPQFALAQSLLYDKPSYGNDLVLEAARKDKSELTDRTWVFLLVSRFPRV
jgi:hypothetical protein